MQDILNQIDSYIKRTIVNTVKDFKKYEVRKANKELLVDDISNKINIVGKNLKKYRELRGFSQRDMCKKMELLGLQMYCSDIHKMEHGTKTIRDFELKAFSIALGISLDQLF